MNGQDKLKRVHSALIELELSRVINSYMPTYFQITIPCKLGSVKNDPMMNEEMREIGLTQT
jgi:hypothetical protein